jgi:hypothetical protein
MRPFIITGVCVWGCSFGGYGVWSDSEKLIPQVESDIE